MSIRLIRLIRRHHSIVGVARASSECYKNKEVDHQFGSLKEVSNFEGVASRGRYTYSPKPSRLACPSHLGVFLVDLTIW